MYSRIRVDSQILPKPYNTKKVVKWLKIIVIANFQNISFSTFIKIHTLSLLVLILNIYILKDSVFVFQKTLDN